MSIKATLDAMVDALRAGGLEADVDAERLKLPGVWLSFEGFDTPTLGGGRMVTTRLFLAVPSREDSRALEALDELLDQVTDIVDPMSPITTAALVIAGSSPVGVPALTFTHTTPEE